MSGINCKISHLWRLRLWVRLKNKTGRNVTLCATLGHMDEVKQKLGITEENKLCSWSLYLVKHSHHRWHFARSHHREVDFFLRKIVKKINIKFQGKKSRSAPVLHLKSFVAIRKLSEALCWIAWQQQTFADTELWFSQTRHSWIRMKCHREEKSGFPSKSWPRPVRQRVNRSGKQLWTHFNKFLNKLIRH